jgi:hypothetical protein
MFRTWRRRIKYVQTLVKHRRVLKQLVTTHVFFLEHSHLSLWGSVTSEDERGLAEAVKRAAAYPGPIVEVGALFGWTTQLLASLKEPEKELIAIDNFCWNPFSLSPADQQAIAERTLRYPIDHCRTRIVVGSTQDFYRTYSGPPPSMVFIDADHSYKAVCDDIAWARSLGVPVITGHDYNRDHMAVKKAVDDCFPHGVETTGSVWMADAGLQPNTAAA